VAVLKENDKGIFLFLFSLYFKPLSAFLSGSEFYVQPRECGNRGIRQVNGRGVDEIPNFHLVGGNCGKVVVKSTKPLAERPA
jgi:hypothetical protein